MAWDDLVNTAKSKIAQATTAVTVALTPAISNAEANTQRFEESVAQVSTAVTAAAGNLKDALAKAKTALVQNEEVPPSAGSSAPEMAAKIKQERVAMFAQNPAGPATGRGESDWRDRFAKPGYQQQPDTAPTASPAP